MRLKSLATILITTSLAKLAKSKDNGTNIIDYAKCEETYVPAYGKRLALYFKWSRKDPNRYWQPMVSPQQLVFCSPICPLPQNFLFYAGLSGLEEFISYSQTGSGLGFAKLPSFSRTTRCESPKPNDFYDTPKKRKTPLSSDDKKQIFPGEYCHATMCPLGLHVFNVDDPYAEMNGYYVANHVNVAKGIKSMPTYRHISKDLYFWTTGNVTHLSPYPVSEFTKCLPRLEMRIENLRKRYHYVDIPFYNCIGLLPYTKWIWVLANKTGHEVEKKGNIAMKEIPYKCGLTHRLSENHQFESGRKPFVVKVYGGGSTLCVGTLITPFHILTLANCFFAEVDVFKIADRVGKCRLKDDSFKDCPLIFASNRDSEGAETITATTYPDAYNNPELNLPIDWVEFHPLFDGAEYDLAVLGLHSIVQATFDMYPICLPQFDGDRLYKEDKWENYQILYSLKALERDTRFSQVRTDLNGPRQFFLCRGKPGAVEGSTNHDDYCYRDTHYKPPPFSIRDKFIPSDESSPYRFEPSELITERNETSNKTHHRFQCDYIYDILARETNATLKEEERQIQGLPRGHIPCFSIISVEYLDENMYDIKCYERREQCLRDFGWCHTDENNDEEYGYCAEFNFLPDKASNKHPFLEVTTDIMAKEKCSNTSLEESRTQICTGHVARGPVEVVLQAKVELVGAEPRIVFEVVEFISGPQRPLVFITDEQGDITQLDSDFDATCHGIGEEDQLDAGAPTYFRYPIEPTWTGYDTEPGSAVAVLYSLQAMAHRKCDFKTYLDREVLVAEKHVMSWLRGLMFEMRGFKKFYAPGESLVSMDFSTLDLTTTVSSTKFHTTTTNFDEVWADSAAFKPHAANNYTPEGSDFEAYWTPSNARVRTKPPLWLIESSNLLKYIWGQWRRGEEQP